MKGGPFEVGNQVLISSHRKLLLSKAMVVSVAENGGTRSRQARLREASASKPLMTCRNQHSSLGVCGSPSEAAYAKAKVAVARKFAVILRRMSVDGTEFKWSSKEIAAQIA